MNLSRHEVNHPEIAQRRLRFSASQLPIVIGYAQSSAASLYDVLDHAWNIVLYGSLLREGAPEIGQAIQIGAQAGAAYLSVAKAGGVPVQYQLGSERLTTSRGPVNESTVHSGTWRQAFSLALLARDKVSIDSLCNFSAELFLKSSTKSPRFHDLFVEAVQSFWTGGSNTLELLKEARAAMDASKPSAHLAEYNAHHWAPELDLVSCLESDPREFEKYLVKALIRHKEYYSANEERRRDAYGFIAARPLVWTALAFDRKVPINVDSDYLPMDLVRADW